MIFIPLILQAAVYMHLLVDHIGLITYFIILQVTQFGHIIFSLKLKLSLHHQLDFLHHLVWQHLILFQVIFGILLLERRQHQPMS